MGLFGTSLVATPQQKAWEEEMSRRFGLGIPADDQAAIGRWASMPQQAPQPPAQPSYERNPLQGIGDLGTRLMAAQSAIDGDFSGAAQLNASVGAEQRSLAQKAAEAARERQEWVWRQQWERDNPKPANNDTVADYEFWKSKLSPQQFQAWVQNKVEPPQYRQGPDGQFYRISPATPPAITEDDWNKGQTIGGPAPQAPGGFRR